MSQKNSQPSITAAFAKRYASHFSLCVLGLKIIISLDLTIIYAGRVFSRIRFWAVLHRLNAWYLQYWVNQVTQYNNGSVCAEWFTINLHIWG